MCVARRRLALYFRMARQAPSRVRRPWRLAALSFALAGLALAGSQALSQGGGCARCGGAGIFSPPQVAAPAPRIAEPRRVKRVAMRFELRPERPKWGAVGGSYVVCVRACDGSFFPVSYIGGDAASLEGVCRSLCPNTEVALYSLPFGGTIDEAVSATGEPYANLPNAHKFEQTYDAGCSCRAPGQSWAEALAAAEAKYGHHPRDILVDEEQSKRLSRPLPDAKAKPVAQQPPQGGTAAVEAVEPAASLDANGVDTGLKAAAATMSRATSGIEYDQGPGAANYGLHHGQTVDEVSPEGVTRRVRILPPAF